MREIVNKATGEVVATVYGDGELSAVPLKLMTGLTPDQVEYRDA